MSAFSQQLATPQTVDVFVKLNGVAQLSVHKLVEFLRAELSDDTMLYDSTKSADDGYRISSQNLREKYGI